MNYKTITHQHIPNTFGQLVYQDEGQIRNCYAEIQITDTPQLFALNIGNEIFKDVEGWKDEWKLEEIEVLKKYSLPSERIERNVLTDYADWYKSNYGYTPIVTEAYIDLFLASATPHTGQSIAL
jgi:hypothetical protein